MTKNNKQYVTTFFLLIFGVIIAFAPFVVHIVTTVKMNYAAMLIIGLVIPPVGWVHGVGIIFGWW